MNAHWELIKCNNTGPRCLLRKYVKSNRVTFASSIKAPEHNLYKSRMTK